MSIPSDGSDYTEGEVLWLLSLTVEEARYLGEDSSLRWWDVHNAHCTLKLEVRRAQLYAAGHTHREIAASEDITHRAIGRHVERVTEAIADFLNDVPKAA